MKILVTGALGYVGIPLMYELDEKYDVIGVDNNSRADWVSKCGGEKKERSMWDRDFKIIKGDLTNQAFVNEIIQIHKPDCVIHLASQPSMPYSQINGERALFTQVNNLSMCLNLLWALKRSKTRLIITTTTGIPGQHYKVIPEEPVINKAGSWYHVSRGFDSVNCSLASRQWELEVLELRTSIVYGLQTNTMADSNNVATRFDTDFYFGTVLNRFVKQALEGKPITVYGKGNQTKPFISLEDCVQSLVNAIDYKVKDRYEVFNQVTECVSIKRLATLIKKAHPVEIKHISNPRKEKESHKMRFKNKKFLKLLGGEPVKVKDGIANMFNHFKNQPLTFTWSG